MKNEEILLIEKYLSGNLSTAEKETLLACITSSDEFRQEFNEALKIKGLIYSAENDSPIVKDVMEYIDSTNRDLENSIMKSISKKKTFSLVRVMKAAAAAAIIIIALKFSFSTSRTVASISKSSETTIKRTNSKNTDYSKLYVNDVIETGDEQQNIAFDDGTKMDLSKKSEMKVLSQNPKKFELSKGSITAEVSPQDKPMKIITNSAIVEILGTKFSLTSQKNNSLLKVTHGRVSITDKKTGENAIVSTGTYTIADGKKMEVIQGNGPLFVSDSLDFTSIKRYVDIEVDITLARKLILVAKSEQNKKYNIAWLSPVIHVNGNWLSLTKIKPQLTKSGSSEVKIYQTSETADQLKLHSKNYVRGISAETTSVIVWELPKGSSILKCRAALLDLSSSDSEVKFEVYTEISDKLLQNYMKKD